MAALFYFSYKREEKKKLYSDGTYVTLSLRFGSALEPQLRGTCRVAKHLGMEVRHPSSRA